MEKQMNKIDITELNKKLVKISKMKGDATIQSRVNHGQVMDNKTKINQLLEEAQANLTLYTSGNDDYAIERYNIIMEQVKKLRENQL